MHVLHVTPTYFDPTSIIGGGERYPTELATWMSRSTPTTLLSFGPQRRTARIDTLHLEVYPVQRFLGGSRLNPLTLAHLPTVARADVVHIHHQNTLVSDLSCLTAALLGKPAILTDYGGGSGYVLNHKLPILPSYRRAVAYSKFGLERLPPAMQNKGVLIPGGIDTARFCPSTAISKRRQILFVGRLLPHKGVNYLIDAIRLLDDPTYTLTILGRVYHEAYYADLRAQAAGLNVEFIHDADDQCLLDVYRSAQVTVLPSVHTSCYGDYTPVPELMGLTLLESQACGTPVVCTDAGAMHEFVAPGKTGQVVAQNSGPALADGIQAVLKDADIYAANCRAWVEQFSWPNVVRQHLALYEAALTGKRA